MREYIGRRVIDGHGVGDGDDVLDAELAKRLRVRLRVTRRDEDQLDRVVALMAQQVDQRLHTIGGHVAEIALLLDAQELFDAVPADVQAARVRAERVAD